MLDDLLKDKKIFAVVCNQFGDTGKGKIVDAIAKNVDIIARGTGGDNCGHTTIVNGIEHITHLIPSGIYYDSQGKINILGNGTVVNIKSLCNELDDLERNNMSYNNFFVSRDANVIMKYHLEADKPNKSQEKGGIGSTGRGIGPAYSDKIARRGIAIADLFNKEALVKKIEAIKPFYSYLEEKINTEEIISELEPYSRRIKPLVRDTVALMHKYIRSGKKVLLEGAQGLMLSIEHGTYPYVTSSDCSLNGLASGVGISAKQVDLPLGIVKFPFMTRVGGGPFPTEFGGQKSEIHCAHEGNIFFETKEYLGMNLNLEQIAKEKDFEKIKIIRKETNDYIKTNKEKVLDMINNGNDFERGIGIRLLTGEYGATTGRPRRTGWTDAVIGKYAVGINGPFMILTKADSLAGINEFSLCTGYASYKLIDSFSKDESFLRNVKTVFKNYEGYDNISDVKKYRRLPSGLKNAIQDFEDITNGKVVAVSNGPEREQIIIK